MIFSMTSTRPLRVNSPFTIQAMSARQAVNDDPTIAATMESLTTSPITGHPVRRHGTLFLGGGSGTSVRRRPGSLLPLLTGKASVRNPFLGSRLTTCGQRTNELADRDNAEGDGGELGLNVTHSSSNQSGSASTTAGTSSGFGARYVFVLLLNAHVSTMPSTTASTTG